MSPRTKKILHSIAKLQPLRLTLFTLHSSRGFGLVMLLIVVVLMALGLTGGFYALSSSGNNAPTYTDTIKSAQNAVDATTLLKVCPEAWTIENGKEYIEAYGEKRASSEFDTDWVKQNCGVKSPR